MATAIPPRVVIVTRPTDLELLIAEHGTREQARFVTRDRPGWFDEALRRDELQRAVRATIQNDIPLAWRRANITRNDLATFQFSPEDIVVPIGQDGLVANVAKYLDRQPVIGINPDPENVEGKLVKIEPAEFKDTLLAVSADRAILEQRTLVRAELDDGQSLEALNEVFIGHQGHQSARYRLCYADREERQSSSGMIIASGTGATGWARSISRERNIDLQITPESHQLVLFVREAFPAPGFGTSMTTAVVDGGTVTVYSEMSEGGVIFGDGIEADFLHFGWGRSVTIRPSPAPLRLATSGPSKHRRGIRRETLG
jgi:hypothetical protein